MSQVWGLDLSQNEKLVLLALADHADDDGYCFPSIRRISWKTDYSERSVQRIIRKLMRDGIVEVTKEASGRPGKPRVYLLDLERAALKAPFETGANMSPLSARRVTTATSTGDKSGATGDIWSATGDIAVSPESSLEPSLESSLNRPNAEKTLREETRKPNHCSCGLPLEPGRYCPSCGICWLTDEAVGA